jgi:hypothetical protein
MLFAVALQQAEKGDLPAAQRTAAHIEAADVRSWVLKDIARYQAAHGDYAGAQKTLAAANEAYPAQRIQPQGIAGIIAEAQISRGEVKAARATIAASLSPDQPADMRAASSVTTRFASRAGTISTASGPSGRSS